MIDCSFLDSCLNIDVRGDIGYSIIGFSDEGFVTRKMDTINVHKISYGHSDTCVDIKVNNTVRTYCLDKELDGEVDDEILVFHVGTTDELGRVSFACTCIFSHVRDYSCVKHMHRVITRSVMLSNLMSDYVFLIAPRIKIKWSMDNKLSGEEIMNEIWDLTVCFSLFCLHYSSR